MSTTTNAQSAPSAPGSTGGLTPQDRRAAIRNVILAQCCGCLALVVLTHGVVLLYLRALHLSPVRIVAYLAIPELTTGLLLIPAAIACDRWGKKRLGSLGLLLTLAGFVALAGSGFFVATFTAELLAVLGLVLYAVGFTLFTAGWFAILSPIVPAAERGSFFGKLRFSWQMTGTIFVACSSLVLSANSTPGRFQCVLAAVAFGLFLRIIFYRPIPELEQPPPATAPVRDLLGCVLRTPGYASFCAYVFLLRLFTGGMLPVFALIEKQVLHFGDRQVVWLANMTMIGSVVGYYLGGRAIDRRGTKIVFLFCHFGFGAFMLAFLARGVMGDLMPIALGVLHFGFGFVTAASSVAISTEMLALIPPENKSLSTAICNALLQGGGALSGLVIAMALKLGLLNDTWTAFGQTLTAYDSLVLAFGGMIVLLVIALGLVPSVLRRAESDPRQ
ncbi:MAG: hypothetical protein A3K19_06255 [Lentisphaerae bacterium RIFOXYB12_FULL_65_16]|nr:MAG: hypothetical protein A3K18_30945 [Lentisphaerae bacterium RIFOXYA12_64_32]OGV91999.1 MAG: hypothetical protein A3K19_06255 [Lentisphaerae bacterium RIFOXYB12_FULL_65_16]